MTGTSAAATASLHQANHQLLLTENSLQESWALCLKAQGHPWQSAAGELFQTWLAELTVSARRQIHHVGELQSAARYLP